MRHLIQFLFIPVLVSAACGGRSGVDMPATDVGGATAASASMSTGGNATTRLVAKSITAGYGHTCALLSGGTVQCWGSNRTTTESFVPVTVAGITNAVTVSAGDGHTCAIASDDTVQCWGGNHYGQLGNGTTTDSSLPVTVSGISGAIAVAAGSVHTCAVLSSGSVQCWGNSAYVDLCCGIETYSAVPVAVSDIGGAVAVAANLSTCALQGGGSVQCWGYNVTGQLGNGTYTGSPTPVTVTGITNAVAVATGDQRACAMLSDGKVQCWGSNAYGMLGNGTMVSSPVPVTVSGIVNPVAISADGSHTCAVVSNGSVMCWGSNDYGELGNGTTAESLVPVTVTGFYTFPLKSIWPPPPPRWPNKSPGHNMLKSLSAGNMRRPNQLLLTSVLVSAACGGRSGLDTQLTNLGGVTPDGGSVATGGTNSMGGLKSLGGNIITGGTIARGGNLATGGRLPTGGTMATGGNRATAGSNDTGGGTCCAVQHGCVLDEQQTSGPDACPSGRQCYLHDDCCGCCAPTWCMVAIGGIGGAASSGGTSATGGSLASGGTANTGGTTAIGGATPAGGSAGSGCTGAFETVQSGSDLCVAKMATITAPSGYSDYGIDVTEVTQGQYDLWLGTKPALPASTDANCGYVTSYAEQGTGYAGADSEHHPVVYVDWCDAFAYCKGVGKRLCGAIGGGTNAYTSDGDASRSQWYRACSSGGTYTFPYGNTYQASYCNGYDYGAGSTVAVGSLPNCITSTVGYSGVYDLSGNVFEWEDCCDSLGQYGYCREGSGAFIFGVVAVLACHNGAANYRSVAGYSIGFRCCSN